MILSERIRKIRESKKRTQVDVAEKCGISSSAYGQIERKGSNSTYNTLCKIAKAPDVSPQFLIDIGNKEFIE